MANNRIEIPVNGGTGKLIYWTRNHKLGLPGKFGLIPATDVDVINIDHPDVAGAPGQQIVYILAEGVLYSYGIPSPAWTTSRRSAVRSAAPATSPASPGRSTTEKGPRPMNFTDQLQDGLDQLRDALEAFAFALKAIPIQRGHLTVPNDEVTGEYLARPVDPNTL